MPKKKGPEYTNGSPVIVRFTSDVNQRSRLRLAAAQNKVSQENEIYNRLQHTLEATETKLEHMETEIHDIKEGQDALLIIIKKLANGDNNGDK